MNEAQILIERIDALTHTVGELARMMTATRLNRADLCQRLGMHRNTLAKHLRDDPRFPRPGTDGRWLLHDIAQWEARQ